MATINCFEELECWQDARVFTRAIYSLPRSEAFRRDYDLICQIRRSAVSVMANIAEGFHRHSRKDFLKFLDYSRASLAETTSHLYVALDQGYITADDLAGLKETADKVGRKINGLVAYLNRRTG
ncbi:MAG: four helix bundle protein [Geobacteraceae bacterium]|nr:four helix bundle protein [Geobacteraceae bacterium]